MNREQLEKFKRENIFKPLNSVEDVQNWMFLYFDIYFPRGTVYPTSTHGPAEAMWRIYELFKTGKTSEVPQVVMVASRDSYKTLSAAAIEVLLFLHFRLPMAHAAAIKFQAGACVKYVNGFFRRVRPYLEHHGWKKTSDNKTLIEWMTPEGEDISLTVLTATKEGMNSRHVPLLVLDELDLMDAGAFAESRLVPSVYKNFSPLILILSTRKFASGLMEQEISRTPAIGGEIFKWNIIDVAEAIPHDVARIHEPKVTRYITTKLPMSNLTPEQFEALSDDDKMKYEKLEAYAGIADHPMLPVMRNYLVDRPQADKKFLYKPLTAVHNNFKLAADPDWAEAQLLCNKPTSSGLVYGRFEEQFNVLSIDQAMEKITGVSQSGITFDFFKNYIKTLGIKIIGGADWGFTDFTSLVILAILPNGDIMLVDNLLQNNLEPADIFKYVEEYQKAWDVDTWYMEQAYPAYLATLRRMGIKCPKFTKVIEDGIIALKSKIVDTNNNRKFFVVRSPNTHYAIQAFGAYRWALDSKGQVIEGKPFHDTDGVSDIMDSIRYPMQNLFAKGNRKILSTYSENESGKFLDKDNPLGHKIKQLAIEDQEPSQKNKKIRITW